MTNVVLGNRRDFSTKVGARVSSTGAFQANCPSRCLHRLARQRRLVDIRDRDFERQGLLPDLFGDARQQDVSLVHRVEGTGEQHRGRRRRQHPLTVGLDGDAIEFACQEPIDRIAGGERSLGIMFVRIEQAARRRRGNPAGAGQP